jgi:hypothetical protein
VITQSVASGSIARPRIGLRLSGREGAARILPGVGRKRHDNPRRRQQDLGQRSRPLGRDPKRPERLLPGGTQFTIVADDDPSLHLRAARFGGQVSVRAARCGKWMLAPLDAKTIRIRL